MSAFYDQQARADRRPVSPDSQLNPSVNNTPAIRMVSYSPPRLDLQPSQYFEQPRPTSKTSQHSHSLSLPRQGSLSPTSATSDLRRDASRRRHQRQRKHQSRELDGRYSLDNDSDGTTTTATSKRSKLSRPSSWAPAAALAAAVSAVTRASSQRLKRAASAASTASSRTAGDGDSSSRAPAPAQAPAQGRRHKRQGSVLSEKSQNIMISAKRSNVSKEGFSPTESALAKPAGAYIPSARGVSKAKLASPSTTSATSKSPANSRHIRDSSLVGDRPRAHTSRHRQPQTPESHSASLSPSLSSARPGARLGLPPASASFSAAAASYLTERSSNISIGAQSFNDPLSPAAPEPSSPASPVSAYSASPSPSQIPQAFPTNYSPTHPSAAFSSQPSSYQSAAYPSSSYPPPTVSSAASSLSHSASSGSLNSIASSQATAPRPHSRRRNIIALHSDKTFSLVPRVAVTPSQQTPSAVPALAASLKSRPTSVLSFGHSFASSTVRSSTSQDRLFSYGAYNSGDHASSPLTTAASTTLEEPSDFDLRQYTPKTSGTYLDLDGPSSWSQRLVGSLRGDPSTPDAKRKGKGRADTFAWPSSSQERFLSPLPETESQLTDDFDGPSASETAGVSSRSPKKKASSVSVQSFASSALSFEASTLSANTNYKIYAHSSSPLACAGQDSFGDFTLPDSQDDYSASDAHPGDTTNVQILGVSSPPASPLPELRPSSDPDQSFASFKSAPSLVSFDTGISNVDTSLPNFVVLGGSSPPASSRYLGHVRSTGSSDFDISSSPPLRPRTDHTKSDSLGTLDSNTNYVVHDHTKSDSLGSLDSNTNYVVHGEPSSIFQSPVSSSAGQQSQASVAPAPPVTASSSSGSSLVTISKPPRPIYSRESLVVQPLKTLRAQRSLERLGYYKSRSRESLRRAASLKSISSIFNQEAASTFFAGQAFLSIDIPPVPVLDTKKYQQQPLPAFVPRTLLAKPKRKPLPILSAQALSENVVVYGTGTTSKTNTRGAPADGSSETSSPPQTTSSLGVPSTSNLPEQPKNTVDMEESPHQWSSQLSTVMSESDDDMNIRLVSRSVSAMSRSHSRTNSRTESFMRGDASVASTRSGVSGSSSGRRSSTGRISNSHMHNMPSISSSLEESASPERSGPAFFRTNSPPPPRTVRDIDEHGDGLADLQDMSSHPSRSGLSGFFTGSSSSHRNLHSSGSMHSMRSVGSGYFPSWVKVYYGKGEPRPWTANGSDQGDSYINNARQRPRDLQARRAQAYSGVDADAAAMAMEAAEAGQYGMLEDDDRRPQGLRRLTSSIWSPHLQLDRRATRFRVWEPPAVEWSATTSRFDRRNMQVLLFTLGFVLPFAWMAAAFLPLPLDPTRAMEKRAAESEGEYGVSETLKQRVAQADENRYQSARWWRRLNRVMSVFGLLVIIAIVALVVVSVEQHWGH